MSCGNCKKKCIKQCTKKDFKEALSKAEAEAMFNNQIPQDPVGAITRFVQLIATGGVFSVPGSFDFASNFYGKALIQAVLTAYTTSGTETDQHYDIRKAYWDCETRTLAVENRYSVKTLVPRVIGPDSQPLPPGFTYVQDLFIVYQFDCDYKMVYNREYFDNAQFISTYTDKYPPVCKIKCQKESNTKHFECPIPFCTTCDRAKAKQIADSVVFAYNLLAINPSLAAEVFAELFAPRGIVSTSINPLFPVVGPIPQSTFTGP